MIRASADSRRMAMAASVGCSVRVMINPLMHMMGIPLCRNLIDQSAVIKTKMSFILDFTLRIPDTSQVGCGRHLSAVVLSHKRLTVMKIAFALVLALAAAAV